MGVATAPAGADVFELAAEDTKNSMPRAMRIHYRIIHIVHNPALWPIQPMKWTVSKEFKAGARAARYGQREDQCRPSTPWAACWATSRP